MSRDGTPLPPSVDALARSIADVELPHLLLVDAARAAVAAGDPRSARARAEATASALLRPVINATGVMLHTNLGRAPISVQLGPGYSNLELDLVTGRRGSRQGHAATLLAAACGAEGAVVVNNGAAALMLVLAALASGRKVVVSRGELVEIGGGFRIPDVLASSGAELVEVGTTNRTRIDDYEKVLGSDPAMFLKVHQSNYKMVGFTEAVPLSALSQLGPPVVFDIGSGLLDATTPWLAGGPPPWLAGEPAARQSLEQGAALVTFSGDKLLGGPQAGVIAGRRDLVAQCARHPMARALRPGGLVLRALQETALAYLRRDGGAIPFWAMATASLSDLRRRAEALGVGEVVECKSVPGGGSIPGLEIPSVGVALGRDVAAALRHGRVPVIARVYEQQTIVDLRTVSPADDRALGRALGAAIEMCATARDDPRPAS